MKNSKVVHLTNVVEEGNETPIKNEPSLMWRAIGFATKVGILMGVSGYLYLQALQGVEWAKAQGQEWYAWGLEQVTVEKHIVRVQEAEALTLSETINVVAEESGINALIFETIASMESSNGRFVYHFEPTLYDRIRGMKSYQQYSNDELRMLASSHGVFHVLGLTALQQCSLKPHELYDGLKAGRCVAKILTALDNQNRGTKDRGERLRLMLTGYNGSGEAAARYADKALGMIGQRLYSRLLS